MKLACLPAILGECSNIVCYRPVVRFPREFNINELNPAAGLEVAEYIMVRFGILKNVRCRAFLLVNFL